ncbi:MAG: flippase-like domain-containing protein, partial [Chloroflexi bacterium]|nr:flippase-like domain-containing protein [Chloroflexota bacterium]
SLRDFRWELLPLILGLTFVNYCLRLGKWHYYLGQIGVRGLSIRESGLVFFSGLSMVVTPGKVGEWLKSYMLREVTGTPFARSAPIIIAERLTDGLAMVALASGGLLLFRTGWPILLLVILLAAAVVGISQHRPLAERLFALAERLPVISSRIHHLHEFYESSRTLFSPRNLGIAVGVGFVSWMAECAAFYFVLVGLGEQGGGMLLIKAAFILATTTLGGSVFLLPAGLGVIEGGLTGFQQVLLGMPREMAGAGTLLIRFCTLWFGVSLGMLALLVLTRRLKARPQAAQAEA